MNIRKLKKQLKKSYGKDFIGTYYNGSMCNTIHFAWVDYSRQFDNFEYVADGIPNGRQLIELYFKGRTIGERTSQWDVKF